MNIFVIGKGQLGSELNFLAENYKFCQLTAVDFPEIDICSKESIDEWGYKLNPDLIVNAAAYTAVDKAESEPDAVFAVNATGPMNLADYCSTRNIPLIHISTDYVFDGTSSEPYETDSSVNPQSVYGKSKLEGENLVSKRLEKYVIIRTAWVYSVFGNNFVKTMLRLGCERDSLSIVADQYGCPTNARDLADAILQISKKINEGNSHWGTFHYTGAGACSWFDFASEIFKIANKIEPETYNIKLSPIPTEQYPTPAARPKYSVLSNSKISELYGIKQKKWEDSLLQMLKEGEGSVLRITC